MATVFCVAIITPEDSVAAASLNLQVPWALLGWPGKTQRHEEHPSKGEMWVGLDTPLTNEPLKESLSYVWHRLEFNVVREAALETMFTVNKR